MDLREYFDHSRMVEMRTEQVVASLDSLAQATRLAIFRLLVKRGPEGLHAGAIGRSLGVPASSLSFHLHQLKHAGLVTQERRSRQLIYATNFARMNELIAYLTENCCGGASWGPVCQVPSSVSAKRAQAR